MRLLRYAALTIVGLTLCGAGLALQGGQTHAQGVQGGGFDGGFGGGFRGGRGGRGGGGPPITLDPAQIAALKTLYVAPKLAPYPTDNPPTPAKVELGRKLFFDPGLSANGKLACASCHDARHGFTDGEVLSLGVKGEPLARHTPTVINLAWSSVFFWDGRAATLEQQAVMPIAEAKEMGMSHQVMVSRLQVDAGYRRLFQRAFPGEAPSVQTVGKALASFERTLVYSDAPFDRWIAGDENAISEDAKRGFVAFNTNGGCAQCHTGWNFSDDKFHDIGLPSDDIGRFGVVADESLKHGFKTPGLRNIAERAPYMHTGEIGTLQGVLQQYRRFIRRDTLSPEMRNVRTRGGGDIVAFLETLTSPASADLIRLQDALDRQTRPNPKTPVTVAANRD
jgi:cytochrome c peroxidase